MACSAAATDRTILERLPQETDMVLRPHGKYRDGNRRITEFILMDDAKPGGNILLALSVDENTQMAYLKNCDQNLLYVSSAGLSRMTDEMFIYPDWKSTTPIGKLFNFTLLGFTGSLPAITFSRDGCQNQKLWHHVSRDRRIMNTMVCEERGTIKMSCNAGIYNPMEKVLIIFFMLRCFYCKYAYLLNQIIPTGIPCVLSVTNTPPIFSSSDTDRILFRPSSIDIEEGAFGHWFEILSSSKREVLLIVKAHPKASEIQDQCGNVKYYSRCVKRGYDQAVKSVYSIDGTEIGHYDHRPGTYYINDEPPVEFRHHEESDDLYVFDLTHRQARIAEIYAVPDGHRTAVEMHFTCNCVTEDVETMLIFSAIDFCFSIFKLNEQPIPKMSYNYRPNLTS